MENLAGRFLYGILAGYMLLTLTACTDEAPTLCSPFLLDYIHKGGTYPLFSTADSLKYRQQFDGAIQAFEGVLSQPSLSEEERWYAANQLITLRLWTNTEARITTEYKSWLDADKVPAGKAAADFCFNKGRWAMRTGDWQTALNWLLKSAGLYEQLYGKSHFRYANCLDEIGILYLTQADNPEDAKAYIEASRDIWSAASLDETWTVHHTLARALAALTLERDGRSAGESSERAWPHAGQFSLVQAQLQSITGRYYLEESGRQKGNNHPKQAAENQEKAELKLLSALNNLEAHPYSYEAGLVYKDIALYLAYCSGEALQPPVGLATYYAQSPDQKGYPYWVQGVIQYNKGNYVGCTKAFERFLHDSNRLNTKSLDNAYYSLADAYMNLNRYDKALEYAQKDHAIGGGDTSSYRFVTYALIGKIYNHKYEKERKPADLFQAAAYFDRVDQLFAQNIPLSTEESGLQFQTQVGDDYLPNAMKTCFQLYQQTKALKFFEQAFRHAERMKSMLMYRDMLYRGDDQNASYLALADSIRMIKGHLNRLKRLKAASETWSEANEAEKKQWELLVYQIQIKQRQMAPEINAIQQAISGLPGIKAALAPDQMVLQYCFAGEYLYAIGIAPNQEPVFVEIPAGEALKKQINLFHQQIQDTRQSPRALSAELGQQLLAPFSTMLSQCRQLLVVPDRELYLIPFDALQYPPALNSYLTEHLAVSYTLSWKVYEANHTYGPNNVHPGTARIALWRDEWLQHGASLQEAIEEATHGGRIHSYVGADCNTTVWEKKHHEYDILHFHMHGKSNLHNRDDNKLYFQAGRDSLQGYDIQAQRFKAYLVVLSACETALGDIKNGEGAFTLARSFQQAGVQQVVATLWSVEEQQTVRLYNRFYQQLSQGKSPAEALQEAKRPFIQGNGIIQHPYFWAGPVLYR